MLRLCTCAPFSKHEAQFVNLTFCRIFDMSYKGDEFSSSQDGLSLYAVWNLEDCPRKLLKRDTFEGHFSYHFSLPLPPQIVVFGVGKWDGYPDNCQMNVSVSLDSDLPPCHIGTLTKDNACLCWEDSWSKIFQDKSKEVYEQNRLARLMASVVEGPSDEEKENRSGGKKLLSPIQNNQLSTKHGSKAKGCETPKSRTPKQQKLSFSGGKKTSAGKQAARTVETKKEKATALSDQGTPQQKSAQKVFGMKRRSISNSPATKRRRPVPNDKQEANTSPVNSPGLPTPPDTPNFSDTEDGPSGRWGHAVAVLDDQKVLVVGGQGMKQQMVKDSLWVLDTESNRWTDQRCEGGGADRRMGHTVTYDPVKQVLYVFGGSKNKRWYSDVNVLDTTTWTWSAVEANGQAPRRAYHSCTLFHGELFVFGGVYPNPDPEADGCSDELFTFNPNRSFWYKPLVAGSIPSPRSGHSASLLGDRLVIFGGWDAPLLCFNDLYILNMAVMEYSKPTITGLAPSPRSWHAATNLPRQRIFIHGGYDGDKILSDSYIFELDTLMWTAVRNPRITMRPRAGHVAFCLPSDDDDKDSTERVAIFGGGNNAGGYFNDYFTFTPSTA